MIDISFIYFNFETKLNLLIHSFIDALESAAKKTYMSLCEPTFSSEDCISSTFLIVSKN